MHQIIRERLQLSIEMRATPGFTPACLAVFEQLTWWENSRTGYTQPGQETIARAIGRCRATVNRAVRWLRDNGWLKTQQRYVLHRDRTLYGTLRYWMAKEVGQVTWLRNRLIEKRWTTARNDTERQNNAVQKWRMPKIAGGKEAVERYWLAQMGCNTGVTTPSNSELNTETLMSPALKRWLEEDRKRR